MEKLERLKKEREELDKRIETLEYAERILEEGDEVYYVDQFENVTHGEWNDSAWVDGAFAQGHIFRTKQEAETEAKRRNLLTRFRMFRNECNGDWKVDWSKQDTKYFLSYSQKFDVIHTESICVRERFNLFGYFKNLKDAEKGVELFGDEIKTLFVDCEEE